MRNRSILVPAAVLALAGVLLAQDAPQQQGGRRGGGGRGNNTEPPAPSVPHDPHDLNGVWGKTRGFPIVMTNPPAMTPEGQAKFDLTKPGYGPRMVPPAFGNDPMGNCDPLGMPRLTFMEVVIYPMELMQTPKRVIQFFEWAHVWREIWTDGRELPKDPDPHWLGYSVGKWDEDTFVVDSVGFDPRTWLDHFGHPVSEEMRLQERYRRLDRDHLELTTTITDPKMYTKPWTSEKKIFQLMPKREIQELFCVPSEEQSFNKRVRDPAGGKTGQ